MQRIFKGYAVLRRKVVVGNFTGKTFDVVHAFKRVCQCGRRHEVGVEFLHAVKPGVDCRSLLQRSVNPVCKHARTHTGLRFVKQPQQTATLFVFAVTYGKFQIATCLDIDTHKACFVDVGNLFKVRQFAFLRVQHVVEKGSARRYCTAFACQPETVQRCHVVLTAQFFGGAFRRKVFLVVGGEVWRVACFYAIKFVGKQHCAPVCQNFRRLVGNQQLL